MKKAIKLDLASEPGKQITIPVPDDGDFPVGHAALGVVATVILAGLALSSSPQDSSESWRPEALQDVMAIGVKALERDVIAQASVLAGDARVRTVLATPEIDRATVEDTLEDLLAAGGLDAIAVFGPEGVLVGSVGDANLADVDLMATGLSAGEARVWSLKANEVVVVAAARVELGDASPLIVCGRRISQQLLVSVRDAMRTSVAVAVGDQVVGAAVVQENDRQALERVARGQVVEGSVVRALADGAVAPRVIAYDGRAVPGDSPWWRWLPTLIMAFAGVVGVVLAARR